MKRKHMDLSKRQKLEPSLKSVYKCPFMIRYSFVAYCKNKALKKPDIFYRVKITQVNFHHTCQMTTIVHRQRLEKSGGLQPDLNGLNDIISLLCEKPMLQSDVLRPLLAKYPPCMILMVDLKVFVGCYQKCAVIYFVLETEFSWTVRKDNTTRWAGHTLALSSRILT
jgi:hypothetical protein